MSENNEEPKIIVDEDWKSQVAREKEEAKNAPTPEEEDGQMGEIPPANFLVFISMLAQQAMAALGLLADPMSGEAHTNRPLAKHFIANCHNSVDRPFPRHKVELPIPAICAIFTSKEPSNLCPLVANLLAVVLLLAAVQVVRAEAKAASKNR